MYGPAELYLNGRFLGRMDNAAFRPFRFDVGSHLVHDRPNVVVIRFMAIDSLIGPRDEQDDWPGRVRLRKPQFCFGWDWSLPLPSVGIAGSAWLECHTGVRIVEVDIQAHVSGRVDVFCEVSRRTRDLGYTLATRITGPDTRVFREWERPGRVRSYVSVQLDSPRLW